MTFCSSPGCETYFLPSTQEQLQKKMCQKCLDNALIKETSSSENLVLETSNTGE